MAKRKRVKAGASKASAEDRRARFVEEYVTNGGNGKEAAIKAGYSPKTSKVKASQLLTEVNLCREIERRRAEAVERAKETTHLTVERTLQEVARLAFFDPRKLYHEDGRLKKVHELDDDTAAAIASVEVDEIGVDGVVAGYTKKIKHWDKNAALEKAMKHLGQYEVDNRQKAPRTVNIGELTVGLDPSHFEKMRQRAGPRTIEHQR